MHLTQFLKRAVHQRPEAIATVFGQRRRTYAVLGERVARLAAALAALGVCKGDRVGILALNSDRYIEAIQAVFWAGGAINPCNTRWSARELAYSFNDSGTEVLLIDDAHLALLPALKSDSPNLRAVIYVGDEAVPDGLHSLEALIEANAPMADAMAGDEDLAAVFYTGGTTGFPKGVMLSHRSMVGGMLNRMALGYPVGPVYLHAAPVFHLAGALGIFWQMMAAGTSVLIPTFTPKAFMEVVQREGVTDTLLVPTMIQMILDAPERPAYDMSSLRFLIYGASPIGEGLLDRVAQMWPDVALMQGYGMTECAGPVTYLPPEFHTLEGRKRNKLRSAGRAGAMAEVKIVDPQRNEVPRGVVGEIAIRGMSNMLGYWNKPQETAHTLQDGWIYSGDGAYMDEEGFVFIVDRVKDMIVTGGENVYSAEVESALSRHPAVAICAVIGIPSDRWGEQVHAIVVLRQSARVNEDELIQHCKGLIANYKCPRSIEFRESLPLTGVGKILKAELRRPFWEGITRNVN
ncbi:fatty-acid--CoA ligase [Cupriavidus lacunae]|uniref:Fatty-acid--CoA ligase n=1 Tax=Cupriavidus lacunae TaxID=2666307 RepID=A0A370NJW0_9BURK|nr:long-chain-fatty-acid--CoA ligase [Cupriavidus lacunae]RDK05867.1 fatty-acid--CoA ligase [Cupriavidus lacunae]